MIASLMFRRKGASQISTVASRIHLDGVRNDALETARNRLLVTGAVFCLAFLAITGRIVDLTMFKAEEPRHSRVPARESAVLGRSDIVDRNGTILATSLPVASLYANPRKVLDAEEAADKIAKVLPDAGRAELVQKLKSKSNFVWVGRNLTPRQQYEVNRLGLPGFAFQRGERRVFPHGRILSHVVGFTDVDGRGLAGVEKYFDETLRAGEEPLTLSLDLRVQALLYEEMTATVAEYSALGAASVVLDVHTGEVVAMVSLPDFDPHLPETLKGEAGFNRVTKGVYEMGSTFKLFTVAMALDAGTVSMQGGYDARYPIKIARFTINDFHPKARWLSVPEILVYSSNIGAAKMAQDVGTRLQRAYLGNLGLLAAAQIELPEVGSPLTPSRWRDINTLTIGYGHGIAVSPLQLAVATASLVNGGIQRPPTLLRHDGELLPEGQRVLSEDTSLQMRGLMRMVVRQGTGKRADIPGYLIGGKTGTADKLAGSGYRNDANVASFVGAFPMDAPRYVILVIVDEPKANGRSSGNQATGGAVAAPPVGRIVRQIAPLLGLPPVSAEEMQAIEGPRTGFPLFASTIPVSASVPERPRAAQ